jgi:hypothetical protein
MGRTCVLTTNTYLLLADGTNQCGRCLTINPPVITTNDGNKSKICAKRKNTLIEYIESFN